MNALLPTLLLAAALLMTLLAAIFDWRHGSIPRWVSLPFLALAPFVHAVALAGKHGPYGLPGPLWGGLLSLLGAALCGAVPYGLFRCGWVGGGDVKVLASLGALLGPHAALPAEFTALILAALFAPTRLAYQGRLFATMGASVRCLVGPLLPAGRPRQTPDALWETVRLSPFVFLGTVTALLGSSLVGVRL
jgi:Flp pilus assembly protein protease CpaA